FANAEELSGQPFSSPPLLPKRYWLLDDPRTRTTDAPWAVDLVADGAGGGKGPAVRVLMAEERGTEARRAVWGEGLAREAGRGKKGAVLDRLTALVVHRPRRRETVFCAVHEPRAAGTPPRVKSVSILARTPNAALVRVEAEGFTD